MAKTKIFVTGVTGYIGGDVFYALNQNFPDFEYSALVRNSDSGAKVAVLFPSVRLVYGTLDDAAILEAESARADIVIHTADSADHVGAAEAIKAGLSKHPTTSPGYWLHTSGTGILCWKDLDSNTFGEPPSQPVYDDLDKVDDLTHLPDHSFHRNVDKIVLAADPTTTKTAILCPPTIYGPGRGPANQRSRQVYNLAKVTLQLGQAPVLGRGLTEWDNVHVHDLSDLFVLLVKRALSSDESNASELWGANGYYLVENGHHVWGEVSRQVGAAAHKLGYIPTKDVSTMDVETAKEKGGFEAISWGLNSRGHARRARKLLGWTPSGASLSDLIPDIVDGEARLLGLKKGYAQKVAP